MTIESSITLKYMRNKISTSYVRTLRNNAFIDKCFIIVIKNVKKETCWSGDWPVSADITETG